MEPKNKETVGKVSRDMQLRTPDSIDPVEIERELHKEYEKNVFECVNNSKKDFPGDFFVIVTLKKEPLMKNVLRNYFHGRSTCPTPDYDQTVYHYHKPDDKLEFLWIVPDKGTCCLLRDHCLEVAEEEKELLGFVLSFYDGSLMRICKSLNGEAAKTPLIIV